MRILFYTDTPNIGGAEKQMLLLAKQLKHQGHQVDLAYGKYSQIKTMEMDFRQVCMNAFALNTWHKHDPRHYFELIKVLKNGPYDLVHIHLWNPGAGRYAFLATKRMKIPIVTTEHDPFELTGIKRLIKQGCLQITQQMIAVSSDNVRLLGEVYKVPENRINMVHNGIDAPRFLDNRDKALLPVHNEDVVITCIAEIHERKGHKYLFQAFLKLLPEMPKLQLILVGTGPMEGWYRSLYGNNKNIHFLGWRQDIPQILKASDLLVLPSLREAFGLVVAEAMASGTAVIATNNGGTVDIIENGKTGILIPPADVEALGNAMRTILSNPHQKADMEKEAMERVKHEFTAERMTQKTMDVYNKAITFSSPLA